MKPLNECCDQWVLSLEPTTPRSGRFTEDRVCPTCKTRLKVLFECQPLMGGDLTCAAVGAERA